MGPNNCKPESEVETMKAVNELLRDYRARVRRREALALSGMAASVVVLLLCLLPAPEERSEARSASEPLERPELVEGGFTEGLDASVMVVGVPLPKAPLPNWRKPPCSAKQREINGACWKKLASTPDDDQCGEDYLYEGSCWAPVASARRAPVTIDQ